MKRFAQALFLAALCALPAAAQTRARAFVSQRLTSPNATQYGTQTPTQTPAQALATARAQHLALPRNTLSGAWTPVGPAQVATALYGQVTGRVTALALDPADPTGNTLYAGTTGGGVWKSTNAAGPAAQVTFAPLTDTLPVFSPNAASVAIPSLSIGALALANGTLLAGTGDPNDATDSLYGEGILRSTDAGLTFTLSQFSSDPYQYEFAGLAVSAFAFSTANPSLAVAALTQSAEGTLVNAPSASFAVKGLYYSTDAGQTWFMATLADGAATVQSPQAPGGNHGGNGATAVVYNPIRQRFYAAVQFHGIYESADAQHWTRLAAQPGPGLTTTACPVNAQFPGAAACPLFRAALAVQPVTGDLFALTIDSNDIPQGLYQDTCNLTGTACAGSTVQWAVSIPTTPLQTNPTTHAIAQADYNLTLAAAPSASGTTLYAGTTDLFRCTLTPGTAGCTLRNTTNAQNGCLTPAAVAPAQHALAALGALLYLGNDGGLYRSTDSVAQTGSVCNAADASHFQNLNPALGSLAEVVSFAQDPADPGALLTGLGALGTAGTAAAAGAWPQLATGEGGTVAIDPATPANWFLSANAAVDIALCTRGSACTPADFTPVVGPTQVANDLALLHAPYLLDAANLITGTCRSWRGPAATPTAWSSANALSAPFGAPAATGCSSTFPLVRSLAAAGPTILSGRSQNSGSQVLYAGLAGALTGGQALGGHLFVTQAANLANPTTVWTDAALAPVTNDPAGFNAGAFDISSVTADPHDATGRTVYATVMGFSPASTLRSAHVYGSLDAGAHWTNLSANLPSAPANSLAVDPNDANTVYVALDTGVYVTTQISTCATQNCWSVFGSALPNAPAVQLLAAAGLPTGDGRLGMLRVGTYGRGIWQIPLLTAISPAAPALALSPVALTFAATQTATQSPAQTVTVTNTGSAPLVVGSVLATGDFVTSTTCLAAPIPQGATCTIDVRFAPTAAGTRAGLLTVYANVAGGQATATLTGTATPPATIVLTPIALAFPSTIVGAQSAVQNITVANTGSVPATLQTPVLTGDFSLSASTCTASLAPQTSCTLSLVFAPRAAGARTGTLSQTDDAGTQVAALSGTGTSPATDALTPLSLTFPAQQQSTASPVQLVTLTNAGDTPLTLIAASIAAPDFTVLNNCGASLAPHSACTFAVGFVPHTIGQATGTLVLADQFRTQTVALSGLGLAPPGVSLSPSQPLNFGAVGVAGSSPAQTVTLTNNGGVSLAVASITLSGDFSITTNACPPSLAPGAACTLTVVFLPVQTGVRAGTLTILSNAPNSPQSLVLNGVGVDFNLALDGAGSATLSSGQVATYTLLLTAPAGLPGTAALTCAGIPAHALCTINPAGTPIAGSTVVTVTVATGLQTVLLAPPTFPWMRTGIALAVLLPLFALKRKRLKIKGLALFALLSAMGCGTPRKIPGDSSSAPLLITPAGTYNLVVAASSTGLVRSVPLILLVK